MLGTIGRTPGLGIEERHLGLVPGNEDPDALARIEQIADVVEKGVDLDAVLALTAHRQDSAVTRSAMPPAFSSSKDRPVRIGIARDRAFGFYYPDDLAAFEQAGADLIPFDTLQDTHLPPLDGIFIGGGFPECFLEPLSTNSRLRAHIKAFIEDDDGNISEPSVLEWTDTPPE